MTAQKAITEGHPMKITINPDLSTIQAVGRLARDVPQKGNKASAFAALQRIVKDLDWDALDDRGESLQDLARLYAHFLPAAPVKAKTPFAWCAKAIGIDDKREHLNYVYVTEAEIVGTDGHSLHVAPNSNGMEPGFYDKAGTFLGGPEWMKYLDTKRIRPNPQAARRDWYSYARGNLEIVSRPDQRRKVSHTYLFPADHGLSGDARPVPIAQHLVDRLYSMNPDGFIYYNIGGHKESVLAHLDGGRIAVLMPLNQ